MTRFLPTCSLRAFLTLLLTAAGAVAAHAQAPSAADYPSIQAALEANPGRMVFVPAGEYPIDKKLMIGKAGGGLYGPGRIVSSDPKQPILQVENASGVQVRDLTFARAEGAMESTSEGVILIRCEEATLENVRVLDNRSASAAISVRQCSGTQIRGCFVQNYMRISVDDRTRSENYGYAFRCIDGTGLSVDESQGTTVQNCRIVERNLLPTREVKEQYGLGQFTQKNAEKGRLMSQQVWDAGYVDNWHQGSAIVINSPRRNWRTLLLGNQIENAAQGIDIHADQVTVANNIISNSFMGMKAMHGSRNILIIGNQFIKNDLWAIGLMPGAASGYARAASGGSPALEPNTDGGSIIANNIISDFGYGSSAWIWGGSKSCNPIRFDHGQTPENPPLVDVLIQGNVIYDSGRDEPLLDGQPKQQAARYHYAVRIETDGRNAPQGLHFSGNIFHPGTDGVSNVPLPP